MKRKRLPITQFEIPGTNEAFTLISDPLPVPAGQPAAEKPDIGTPDIFFPEMATKKKCSPTVNKR
jgi:hypothetical protein